MLRNNNFKERVYKTVKGIKKGKVMTYKEVAYAVGSPRAFRAVGNILNKNKNKNIPCHRVIKSNGNAGGYNRGRVLKVKILKKEGLKLKEGGKILEP